MSIARLALRKTTVHALRGMTLAGAEVLDSSNTPIDEAAEGAEIPFVAVYTDDGTSMPSGTSLFHTSDDNIVSVVIEIGVTTRMRPTQADIQAGTPADAIGWAIPTTDPGIELTVDAIERQIIVALMRSASPWCELWRDMAASVRSVKSQRGGSGKDGMRFAGRQIVIEVETFAEPQPDIKALDAGTIWRRFVDLCATDADLAAIVPTVRALIAGAPAGETWQAVAATYGLSRNRADAMLISPASPGNAMPAMGGDVTLDPVTLRPAPIGEVV